MSIYYEQKGHCLNCWQDSSSSQVDSKPNASFPINRTKISLRKQQYIKPRHLPASLKLTAYPSTIQTMQSTIRQRTQNQNDLNLPLWQLQKSIPLNEKQTQRQVLLSDRVYINRPQNEYEMSATVNLKRERPVSNKGPLITKNQYLQTQEAHQPKGVIPTTKRSLEQISKMKKSVISIFGPQEKAEPRVQESAIMIDFFSPNSRVTQVEGGHRLR